MKAPDKIYVHVRTEPKSSTTFSETLDKNSSNVAYIRKDALLEWVKECYEVTENDNLLSNIFKQGALYELHRIIAKIESL